MSAETTTEPWTCSFCSMEVGAFELGDGRLIGYGCIRSALREAATQHIEDLFDLHLRCWLADQHLHLGDVE